MRAIIVDDEPLMIKRFIRLSSDIEDINIVGEFECAEDALEFVRNNTVDVAFLDVEMPIVSGISLAKQLKQIKKDILIVFITAYDKYIKESNDIGGDYYIVKPYNTDVLRHMMNKIRILSNYQAKNIYIQTFGRFVVKVHNKPIRIQGKAKEILAYLVSKRGKEASNEEIYSVVWEDRPYSNKDMVVYYNAIKRLKTSLAKAGIEDLLISTSRGKMINTELFDCDYYAFKDNNMKDREKFEGEFLSEYSWGEPILTDLLNQDNY